MYLTTFQIPSGNAPRRSEEVIPGFNAKAAERHARAADRLKAQEEAEKALAADLKAGLAADGDGPTVEEIPVLDGSEPEPEPEPR